MMHYSPLHEPERQPHRNRRYRGEDGLALTCRARSLWTQIDSRTTPSPGIWGPDLRRQKMATLVCSIIQDVIGWSNAYYIPEDPLNLLLKDPNMDGSMDGFEWERTFLEIRLRTGYEPDPSAFPSEEATLNDLVDAVLQGAPHFERVLDLSHPRASKAGSEACPFLAVFLDLRERLILPPFDVPRSRLSPSERVCGLVEREFLLDLRRFVDERFGAHISLPQDGGSGILVLGLTATVAILVLAVLWLLPSGDVDSRVLKLTLGILIVSLFVRAWRLAPRLLSRRQPRLRYRMTLGELAKLILQAEGARSVEKGPAKVQ